MVNRIARTITWSGLAWLALTPVVCQGQNLYQQTNLVTDGGDPNITAAHTDPALVNPWGISFLPGSPFWISDNGTGLSTLYNKAGVPFPPPPNGPLQVSIPGDGTPTGTVADSSGSFNGDRFLFASEDGTISGWKGGPAASTLVPGSAANVYKGLALGSSGGNNYLYAANFRAGTIDAFNTSIAPAFTGQFVDPNLPSGYAPFNVANIGGTLYVTYAKQDQFKHDDQAGTGNGFIDKFSTDGTFLGRFATGSAVGGTISALDSPWAMALAPSDFGAFSNDLLVGNFGSGAIDAFDSSGDFLGSLKDQDGKPLLIDGLWGLAFGGGGTNGGDPNKLYFTAGPNDESNGLFGSLTAVPEPSTVVPMLFGTLSVAGFLLRRRKA
jgi:uncharacterized protein (TIGR03118 family)